MKRIVLIFFMLVATPATHAQVREFQIGALQNSIVRSVYADYQLIYTQPTVDSGFFILYRAGDPTAQAFRVPDKWEIHDVRIHNGAQVFFCGRCGGQALVGSFVIPVAFSGAGGLDYYLCGWSNDGYVLPTDFQRLDLYRSGDTVCMAMTGTSMWFKTSPQPNTTVASAYFIGSTCYIRCYNNKGHYIKFTDVACLDDMIVAVGTDTSGNGCLVKTFGKWAEFPNHPLTPSYMVSLDYESPVGDVLAVHRGGDTAVLAQYNDNGTTVSTVLYDVPFSPFTGVPTMTSPGVRKSSMPTYQPYGPSWRMLELNWLSGYAWLLQRSEYGVNPTLGVIDWLVRVPFGGSGPVWMWHPQSCNAQSLDINVARHLPSLSGENTWLRLYDAVWYPNSTACYDFWNSAFVPNTARWHLEETDDPTDWIRKKTTPYSVNVFNVRVDRVCQ